MRKHMTTVIDSTNGDLIWFLGGVAGRLYTGSAPGSRALCAAPALPFLLSAYEQLISCDNIPSVAKTVSTLARATIPAFITASGMLVGRLLEHSYEKFKFVNQTQSAIGYLVGAVALTIFSAFVVKLTKPQEQPVIDDQSKAPECDIGPLKFDMTVIEQRLTAFITSMKEQLDARVGNIEESLKKPYKR